MVQRIALERLAAPPADQAQQIAPARRLAGGGAGVVIDFLFYNGAVDVVRAEALRDLGYAGRHHNPVRFDVIDIVQPQSRFSSDPGSPTWLAREAARCAPGETRAV